jgi:DNA ligase-1
MLDRVVREGGEGLMLHRGASRYRAERSDDLLKLKPFEDAEARVVGHVPGQGKLAGMLGALLVETPDGKRFRIGSGLSDAQRRDPPPLGSWVSYRHVGLHDGSGLPRFARFLRVREDMPALQPAPSR